MPGMTVHTVTLAGACGLLVGLCVGEPLDATANRVTETHRDQTEPQNIETLRRAAEQGDVDTLRRAAGQGDAEAQLLFGEMFAEGRGVPQNYALAAQWYRAAADQGDARAPDRLDGLYELENGEPLDNDAIAEALRALADENTPVAVLPIPGLPGYATIAYAAFSPDGTRVAISNNGMTWVWPVDGSGELVRLWGTSGGRAAFSPDGTRLVTYSTDGVVRVFPTNGAGTPILLEHVFPRGDVQSVGGTAFNPTDHLS